MVGSLQGPLRPRLGVLWVSAYPAPEGGWGQTCELCWEVVDLAGGGKGSLVTPCLIHKVGLEGEQDPARAMQSPAVAVPGVWGVSSPQVWAPGKSEPRGCPPVGRVTPQSQPALPMEKRKGSKLTFPSAGTAFRIHIPMDSIEAAGESWVAP